MRRGKALLKILVLLVAGLQLSSCGVQSTGRNRTLNTVDLGSQSIAAECNTFSATGLQMLGRIKTYTDNNGNNAEDVHQLVFSDVPNSFLESSSQAIRFFRWKAVGTATELDPEALDFRIEVDNGFGTYIPVTGYTDYFTKDDLIKINSDYALGETDYIAVLRRLRFAIFGTDFSYQALQAVLYNEGSIVGKADMLLPLFDADPVSYGLTHANVLTQLHPLYGRTDLSQEQILAAAQALCSGF